MSADFFPQITRSQNYEVKADQTFYDYTHYRVQINTDCQDRCVYCDAMLREVGHEGFHLDHFRPKLKFPLLKDNPHNLVISCSKCNRWKSSHWPIDIQSNNSHDGISGFVEPFQEKRSDYFQVQVDGKIVGLKGPSNYIINLLHLNRPSRILVRRIRMLSCKIDDLLNAANEKIKEAQALLMQGGSIEEAVNLLVLASKTIEEIKTIRDSIATSKV